MYWMSGSGPAAMSSGNCPCPSDVTVTTTVASLTSIPLDLRLDVLSRLDITGLIRYGAASKPARRDILSEEFRRRLALLAEARRGFDPAILIGFSCRLPEPARPATGGDDRVAQKCAQQHRFDASLLESFDPVAWRDGLVVLLRRPTEVKDRLHGALSPDDLRVCNSLTGQTCRLPPAAVQVSYPHALLTVGDGGRSFQLLAVDAGLRTQTFSSKDGKWGPIVQTHYAAAHLPYIPPVYASRAMVLGGRVYWLCMLRWERWTGVTGRRPRDPCIISVSLDGASSPATRIEVPPESLGRMRVFQSVRDGLMLAQSPDGRPSLLTAENQVISMWTLSSADEGSSLAARWTRQVVIRRNAIEHEPGPNFAVQFLSLGERSGTVVLQMEQIGLVQLNLVSKQASVISRDEPFKRFNVGGLDEPFRLCLHEIDLPTLLQAMKPF